MFGDTFKSYRELEGDVTLRCFVEEIKANSRYAATIHLDLSPFNFIYLLKSLLI